MVGMVARVEGLEKVVGSANGEQIAGVSDGDSDLNEACKEWVAGVPKGDVLFETTGETFADEMEGHPNARREAGVAGGEFPTDTAGDAYIIGVGGGEDVTPSVCRGTVGIAMGDEFFWSCEADPNLRESVGCWLPSSGGGGSWCSAARQAAARLGSTRGWGQMGPAP